MTRSTGGPISRRSTCTQPSTSRPLSGGYEDLAAEAAARASTINALQDAVEESDRWMSFAERYAEDKGIGTRSRVMLARGIRQWKLGESGAALVTFEALVEVCEDAGLEVRAMQSASLCALVTEGDAQLTWSLKAIDICQGLEQPRWEGSLWSNHGWLLEARGDFKDASRCFERARALLTEGAASAHGPPPGGLGPRSVPATDRASRGVEGVPGASGPRGAGSVRREPLGATGRVARSRVVGARRVGVDRGARGGGPGAPSERAAQAP